MKRYVLLVGGTGARLADALLVAASAGAFPAGKMSVLLADTDRRGVRSAGLVAAKMADYARIHQTMENPEGPFRTEVAFSSWPAKLPEDASTLSQLTSGSEADALLCQALFDHDAAELDLHEGFHGRRMLGMVTYAGLLQQADQDHEDVLSCMVDEMNEAVLAGEEVRVVLAGSICGGTGAAGIAALSRYIRKRTESKIHLGAVLLHASQIRHTFINRFSGSMSSSCSSRSDCMRRKKCAYQPNSSSRRKKGFSSRFAIFAERLTVHRAASFINPP